MALRLSFSLLFIFLCQPVYSSCRDLFADHLEKNIFNTMKKQNHNYIEFSLVNGKSHSQSANFYSYYLEQNNINYKDSYIFEALREFGHESLHFIREESSSLKSIIAIHNTVLGKGSAVGGTRMWKYDNEGEALKDVLRLSEGMTYKSAMAHLPLGGGKAVILGDAKTEKTEKLLKFYGVYLNLLNQIALKQQGISRRFVTAEDVGMSPKDIAIINRTGKGSVIGLPGKSGDPSISTAQGVIAGIESAVHHLFGVRTLKDLEIHVQGLGNVGRRVVEDLSKKGAKVSVYDIDEKKTRCLSKQFGLTMKSSSRIITGKCDVFAPCALGAVVNSKSVNHFKCKIIAGAANNQLESAKYGDILNERGILYAPDYVINGGGVINASTEFLGMERQPAELWASQKTKGIYDTLSNIFQKAEAENIGTHTSADRLAKELIKQAESR